MSKIMQRVEKKVKYKSGFTLIELIVVIVIIGILASIVIPRLSGFSNVANQKADIAMGKTIATAALTYYNYDKTMADTQALVDEGYLATLPKAQTIKNADFIITWDTSSPTPSVTITVDGGAEVYPNPSF